MTRLTDLPAAQRPRERLLAQGAQRLSDMELLSVFLRTGIPGKNALQLSQELIARFGSLHAIVHAPRQDFCKIKGLGLAKWANLAAAAEITRRSLSSQLQERSTLNSPEMVGDYLKLWFSNRSYESFVALFLDVHHRLIEAREMFQGTVNQTAVYPREVAKVALQLNASAIIVSHNHPSGILAASPADEVLTRSMVESLKLVDVRLLDHIIVAGNKTLSFASQGLL